MTADVSAASTGDQSGTLLQIGEDPGIHASCILGCSGPSVYFGSGKNVRTVVLGAPAPGVASWVVTLAPGVYLGIVQVSVGFTTGTGYTNSAAVPKFKLLDFGPGVSPNPVRVEVYLANAVGAPVDPFAELGATGYVTFSMAEAGSGYGES